MIAIIDYGVGNLFSLKSSFAMIGEKAVVTGDPAVLREADRLVLPGVGAFADAARRLREAGLDEAVKDEARRGKLLLIGGKVVDMTPVIGPGLKVPHIGWNALRLTAPDHPLWKYIRPGSFVYFVHSYFASDCTPDVIAVTEYGAELTAAVGKENILGCQFHPEKSGEVGLNILRAFCEMR